jgi:hypothetical protein
MTPWTGDQPAASPLPTQDKNKHQCRKRDSNRRFSVGASKARPFDRAAAVSTDSQNMMRKVDVS